MDEEILIPTCAMVIVCIVLFVVAYGFSYMSCSAKTEGLYAHKFKTIGGCMVKKNEESLWIPLENLRDF